jgi:M61 glycyl aminopeptidase
LMFGDLLPNSEAGNAEVEVNLPDGWQVFSGLKKSGDRYSTSRIDQAVLLVARSIKQQRKSAASINISVAMAGNWPVSVGDIAKIAGKMVQEYSTLTAHKLHDEPTVMLIPFPGNFGTERWTAETRGNSLVLLLGSNATRQQILGRIGVIFTHEIFHFWVPNSLQLVGDYDWFFEGFTIYLALKTALRTHLIDFDEYLATLGRVYDSYMLTFDRDRLSLIELSERRWTSGSSLVYDKGMLAALVFDLHSTMMRTNSGLLPLYQELFSSANASPRDGNEVIIPMLDRLSLMNGFSRQFVTTPGPIDLEPFLAPYGIRIEREGFQTTLQIDKNMDYQQRRLLKLLGY